MARKPNTAGGFLRVQSEHHVVRQIINWLGVYLALHLLLTLVAAGIGLSQRQLSSWLVVLMAGLISFAIFVIYRIRKAQPAVGRLLIPIKGTTSPESARIELPASWQGPVEMEVRWNLPQRLTNQVGVQDKEFEADLLELPMVGGNTSRTHLPIELPEIPDELKTLASSTDSDQLIKLEVAGLVGGYEYEDGFEFPLSNLPGLMVK